MRKAEEATDATRTREPNQKVEDCKKEGKVKARCWQGLARPGTELHKKKLVAQGSKTRTPKVVPRFPLIHTPTSNVALILPSQNPKLQP